MEPRGATVLITGASSGIGAAAARAFAAEGANVVLAARSRSQLEQLAAELPGSSLIVPTDVQNLADVQNLVDQALATYQHIDILINNAGVGVVGPVESLAVADLETVFAVNVIGALATIQAVLPHMRLRRRGHIINVSSVVGVHALPYAGGYAASKAALDRLSESLRMELHGSGIAVTLFRPGTTKTPFATKRLGKGREKRRLVPAGVSPDVVAQALVRASRREPRVAYATRRDYVQVVLASLVPGPIERLLTWAFQWETD